MRSALFALLLSIFALGVSAATTIDASHPDQSYQALGFERTLDGHYDDAQRFFRLAARFGDKPSQLAVAFMYYEGLGTPVDKANAYAWSDLASERGYPQFLATRERIWGELDAAERERAVELGASLYREYGDSVAKPRLEARLSQGYKRATGSRTGAVDKSLIVGVLQRGYGPVRPGQLSSGGANSIAALAASSARVWNYYSDARWKPAEYWPLVDSVWLPEGKVTVGDLKKVDR